jgi:hypothetical protein
MRNSSRRLRTIAHRCPVPSRRVIVAAVLTRAWVNTILSTAAADGDAQATRDRAASGLRYRPA